MPQETNLNVAPYFDDFEPSSNYYKVLYGHMSSTATANAIAKTEVVRDPDSFADIVRGLHVFGRKVLRSDAHQARHLLID